MWHLITHSYTSDLQQALRNPQEILLKQLVEVYTFYHMVYSKSVI